MVYGDATIVGAHGDNDNVGSSGSADVFVRNGVNNWSEQAKLVADDGEADDYFGASIGMYYNTVLLWVHTNGPAYVYHEKDWNNSW